MGFLDRFRTTGSDERQFAEKKVPVGSYGQDGDAYLEFAAGGPDFNPELSGRAKYDVYDEMRFSDPAVASTLLMYKLPIRAALWTLSPAGENPEDRLVAEATSRNFGIRLHLGEADADLQPFDQESLMDLTWDESLHQALLYLDFGAMFEEIVWGEPVKWKPKEGEERLLRPIERLAPRYPATIAEMNTAKGKLSSIEQDLPDCRPIPADKLVWYVLDREGGSYWGRSLLRPMYGSWRLKKALMISSGIAYDRFSSGVPWVSHPPGQEQKALMIGRNYRSHERAWITTETPKGGEDGWDIELLGGSGTIADPLGLLRFYDEQIATASLLMFSRLGMTEQGSRAVGEVLSDPYYLSVWAVAQAVRDQRRKMVFRKFVDENFGPEYELPLLNVSKIEGRKTEQIVNAVVELGSVFNLTYPELLAHLCAELGIPAPPEDHPLEKEGAAPAPDTGLAGDTSFE